MQSPLVALILFISVFVAAQILLILGAFKLRARGGAGKLSTKDMSWVGVPLLVALASAGLAAQAYSALRAETEHGAEAQAPQMGRAGAPAAPGEHEPEAAEPATMGFAAPPAGVPAGRPAPEGPGVEPEPGEAAAPIGADALAAQGKTLYEANCASCHQINGQGLPGTFPPIAGAEVPNGSPEEHIKIVLDGQTGPTTVKGVKYNGAMPAWKATLDAQQIAAVVTYERTAFGNKGGAVTVEQVRKLGGK